MPAETLHALLARLFGTAMPIAQMLERPIIVPVARSRMWDIGDQLSALQDWLEEDDG
jgi:hypothetical protein